MGLFSFTKRKDLPLKDKLAEVEIALQAEEVNRAKLETLRAERQELLRSIEAERLAGIAKERGRATEEAYALHDGAIARLMELAPPVLILLGVVRATGPDGGSTSSIEFRCEAKLVNAACDLARSLGVDVVNGGAISRGLLPPVPRSIEDARRALEGLR